MKEVKDLHDKIVMEDLFEELDLELYDEELERL